eukprot:5213530-Pyramimonas_sp.AAC.1
MTSSLERDKKVAKDAKGAPQDAIAAVDLARPSGKARPPTWRAGGFTTALSGNSASLWVYEVFGAKCDSCFFNSGWE